MAPVSVAPLASAPARRAYEAVLAHSPQRSAFATLAFADAACAAFGYRGQIARVGPSDQSPTAAWIVFEKRLGPLRVAARPPMADYAGPILAAPLREADVHRRASPLDALARWARHRYHQVTWVLHPTLSDARPLAWAGWRLTPTWEYSLPATNVPTAGFRPSARRLADAHATDYTVEPAGAAQVADLAAGSLVRKGLTPVDARQQTTVAQALVDAGLAHAWTIRAHSRREPEAGLVALFAPPVATYWMVGGTHATGAATLLLAAHLVREAQAAGCARVSLGGANVPSVAAFKRSLGATLASTLVARTARGPLALREALTDVRSAWRAA